MFEFNCRFSQHYISKDYYRLSTSGSNILAKVNKIVKRSASNVEQLFNKNICVWDLEIEKIRKKTKIF